MWDQQTGLTAFQQLPYYKSIAKAFLQRQIHFLLEQMSEEVGEESLVMTVNLENGCMSHIGSKVGKAFLDDREDVKSQFLSYCISCSHGNIPNQFESQKAAMYGQDKRKYQESQKVNKESTPSAKRTKKRHLTTIKKCSTDHAKFNVNSNKSRKLGGNIETLSKALAARHTASEIEQDERNLDSISDLQKLKGKKSLVDENVTFADFEDEQSLNKGLNTSSYTDNSFSQDESNTNDSRRQFELQQSLNYRNSILRNQSGLEGLDTCDESTDYDTANPKGPGGEEKTALEKDEDGCMGERVIKVEPLDWEDVELEGKTSTPGACMYMSPNGVVSVSETGRILRQAAKPRTVLTIAEKFKILEELEANPQISQRKLAERYNVGKTTIGHILRNREVYKSQLGTYAESQRKRFSYKNCKYNHINNLVWDWYSASRCKGLLLSGVMVQEKALEFAKDTSVTDFKASTGWLASWQSRYNVKSFRASYQSGRFGKSVKAKSGKSKAVKKSQVKSSLDTADAVGDCANLDVEKTSSPELQFENTDNDGSSGSRENCVDKSETNLDSHVDTGSHVDAGHDEGNDSKTVEEKSDHLNVEDSGDVAKQESYDQSLFAGFSGFSPLSMISLLSVDLFMLPQQFIFNICL